MACRRTVKVHQPEFLRQTREIDMALISLKSLGVTMSAPLFSNLDLTIGAGDRLGIVAANGRGKSTLLRCLAGELDATAGDIIRSRGLRVGHVEQSVPDALLDRSFHQLVADALPPSSATASCGASTSRWIRSTCPRRCAAGRCAP
ncbi:hypothetical protein MPLB_1540065 [Mesorhizobium sp. ORS 3324]|nr:hypothetical protein MPLB_1540065 [Mesorhizobium sp. ORS 3324]